MQLSFKWSQKRLEPHCGSSFVFQLKIYLFIYLYFWLHWVFVAAHRLRPAVCRLLVAVAPVVA